MTEPDAPRPFRVLPAVTPDNEHFWLGGAEGELRMLRCQTCGWWIHPPAPVCPIDLSRDIRPEVLSGRGTRAQLHGELAALVPQPRPALRGGHRRAGRAGGPAPDHQPGGRRARRGGPSASRCGSPSRTTTACGSRSSSPIPDGAGRHHARHRPPVDPAVNPAPRRSRPPGRVGERRAVISGVGQSQIGRRIYRDPLELTIDAALAAIADAGLTRADIDGLSTYPGQHGHPAGVLRRRASPRSTTPCGSTSTGSRAAWSSPASSGSVVNAIAAVSAGLCNHVLCFRTVWEASAQGDQGRASVTSRRGRGQLQGHRVHAVDAAVRGAVGVELDRDDGRSATSTSSAPPASSWPRSPSTPGATRRATPTPSTAIP